MKTLAVLFECAPFFGFVGVGVYLMMVGLFPSWRDARWRRFAIYINTGHDEMHDPRSWLVRLGWVKPAKPIAEGEMQPEVAVWTHRVFGVSMILVGVAGLCFIVYLNVQ